MVGFNEFAIMVRGVENESQDLFSWWWYIMAALNKVADKGTQGERKGLTSRLRRGICHAVSAANKEKTVAEEALEHGLDYPLTIANAAILIPMTKAAMFKYLSRHKDRFPPRYRRAFAGKGQRKRILYASEVRQIRDYYVDSKPYHPIKILKELIKIQ